MLTYRIFFGSSRSMDGTSAVYTLRAEAYELRPSTVAMEADRDEEQDITFCREVDDNALPNQTTEELDRSVRKILAEQMAKFLLGVQ